MGSKRTKARAWPQPWSGPQKQRCSFIPVVALLSLLWFASEVFYSLDPPRKVPQPDYPCTTPPGFVDAPGAICSNLGCNGVCFPRVKNICVGWHKVHLCEPPPKVPPQVAAAGGGVPRILRLKRNKPRAKVPVVQGECEKNADRWVRGPQFLADLKMMPAGKNVGANPHHEAEKVVPAVMLSQQDQFANSTLYWLAAPAELSPYTRGFLEAFSGEVKVEFVDLVGPHDEMLCFEEVVLFSEMTNSRYLPREEANDWLREQVLSHCGIEPKPANRPVRDAIFLARKNSSRIVVNSAGVIELLEDRLKVPVRVLTAGEGDFCQQVRVFSEADLLVTPHGSHNAGFLFARPGATVLELFPFLYYIDFFKNYVHAARLRHHEVYGTWPKHSMPFRMRLYAWLYGWERCFAIRSCMNYGKGQNVYLDMLELRTLLDELVSSCKLEVKGHKCK